MKRSVIGVLAAAMIVGAAAPPQSRAMLAPVDASHAAHGSPEEREAGLKAVRAALESKQLRQRLAELKLTPEQIDERLKNLSQEEIHQAARKIEALNAGGDVAGVLVVAILVLLIVYLIQRV